MISRNRLSYHQFRNNEDDDNEFNENDHKNDDETDDEREHDKKPDYITFGSSSTNNNSNKNSNDFALNLDKMKVRSVNQTVKHQKKFNVLEKLENNQFQVTFEFSSLSSATRIRA